MNAPQTPEYRLEQEPDGRSLTVRENLVDILERELLGPANGPEEVLDGVPDVAYLVGRIAPVRLASGREDPSDANEDEAATDRKGPAAEREVGQGEGSGQNFRRAIRLLRFALWRGALAQAGSAWNAALRRRRGRIMGHRLF